MSLPTITKNRKRMATIATCWIPFKVYRKYLRGILLMGIKNWRNVKKFEKTAKFENELSVVAIMKNEGAYLKEWLDFHILVGVDKFYLYDNGSTDDTKKILAPYIKKNIVHYTCFPGVNKQNVAYIDALNRFSNSSRWIAFIDLDEFIVPVTSDKITDILNTLPPNTGALVLTWVMFGSSGHQTQPNGLVIENYRYCGDRTRASGCKTIVNPRLVVVQRNPHINDYAGFIVDENGKKLGRINQTYNPPSHEKIRCNHYVTKSYSEYMERYTKGRLSGGLANQRSPEKFHAYDTNDVFDTVMDRFIKKLKS